MANKLIFDTRQQAADGTSSTAASVAALAVDKIVLFELRRSAVAEIKFICCKITLFESGFVPLSVSKSAPRKNRTAFSGEHINKKGWATCSVSNRC
ncbi:hypothetical protein [Neisseria animaloris]|uniref:hypothetical protein n=1 Tax=Neisseria animaloris TaxID=326522 RepID=UPI000A197E9D|nr:hypothetical protein [Neisseria animaloris]OSI08894.1 hypothetical protein BWD08_01985 [Neisseria animaloris]